MGGREDGVPQPTPVEEGGGMKGVSPLVRGREPESEGGGRPFEVPTELGEDEGG